MCRVFEADYHRNLGERKNCRRTWKGLPVVAACTIYTLITHGIEVGQGGLKREANGGCGGRGVVPVTLAQEK